MTVANGQITRKHYVEGGGCVFFCKTFETLPVSVVRARRGFSVGRLLPGPTIGRPSKQWLFARGTNRIAIDKSTGGAANGATKVR